MGPNGSSTATTKRPTDLASAPPASAHRIVANSLRFWLCALVAVLAAGAVRAQTLELERDQSRRGLAPVLSHVLLPGTPHSTLAQARALPSSGFAALDGRYIDFGYTPDTIWLRLEVHNASAGTGEWLLSLNVRHMKNILVHFGGDADRVLLSQTQSSTFRERPIRHRHLAIPFSLAAGERAALLIGYDSNGSTAMPLSIETPETHAERYAREDAINAVSYAALAFMIVLMLLQSLTFRQPGQSTYVLYLSVTLAYIVHLDGLTFQYLWPEQPAWNSYASIPLGLGSTAIALVFARGFTETGRVAPVYDKLMLALIAVAVIMTFGGLVIGEVQTKRVAFLLNAAAVALCLGAGLLAHWRGRPAMRFFVIGWIGVFAGAFLWTITNSLPALVPRTVALAIPKVTLLFDALMFSMALADRSRQWRIERDTALRRELEALQAQHRTAQQLHEAERERLEALLVAQARGQQLAMASHDIRQPLASLRLTLERLAGNAHLAPVAEGFKQSIDYLDRLTEEYSAEPAADASPNAEATAGESVFDVETLLENIDLMFRDEAGAKGLRLRRRAQSVEIRGDAMATMRIVSNLVANAVKYTREGKILIGCRKRSDYVTVVVADTGPGILPDELERVLKARERGSSAHGTEGHGLGLGIASALAAQHGFGFRCRSTPGRGTAFFVDMPRRARTKGGADAASGTSA